MALVVATLLAGLVCAPAAFAADKPKAAAPSKDRITVGIQPSGPKKHDLRPNLNYTAEGGSVIHDYVSLSNYTAKPVTVSLYATDGFTTKQGGFDLLPSTQKAKDLGTWITLDRSTVTIPARSSLANGAEGTSIVGLTIKLPRNATAGDHAAGVVVSLTGNTRDSKGNIVKLEQRVATRVYLRVSGDLRPQLAITKMKAKYHGTTNPLGKGYATVVYTVTNFGNLRIGAHQRFEVSGLFNHAGVELPDVPELTPGDSVEMTAQVEGIFPTGRINGKILLTAIRQERSVDPLMKAVNRSVGFAAIPLPQIVLLGVLLGGAYLVMAMRRRGQANAGSHRKGAPTKAPGAAAKSGGTRRAPKGRRAGAAAR